MGFPRCKKRKADGRRMSPRPFRRSLPPRRRSCAFCRSRNARIERACRSRRHSGRDRVSCRPRRLQGQRAVKFPFMDSSTLDKRRRACEAEIAVNRARRARRFTWRRCLHPQSRDARDRRDRASRRMGRPHAPIRPEYDASSALAARSGVSNELTLQAAADRSAAPTPVRRCWDAARVGA